MERGWLGTLSEQYSHVLPRTKFIAVEVPPCYPYEEIGANSKGKTFNGTYFIFFFFIPVGQWPGVRSSNVIIISINQSMCGILGGVPSPTSKYEYRE